MKELKKKLETIRTIKAFFKYKGMSLSKATKDCITDIEFQADVEGIG